MAAVAAHARCGDHAGRRTLSHFTEAELREYRRRHPHLFPESQAPASATKPSAGLPRSASNGYVSEAAFQAAAVEQLIYLGWEVQEGPQGSKGGGPIFYTAGWPDLTIYRQDGQRRLWFAELKQPGNKPSPEQLACHARLRAAGFRVIVCWTLEELLAIEEEERP